MTITIPFQIEAAPPDKDIGDVDPVYEYNLYLYSGITSECFQTIARSNGDLSLIEELWNITDPAMNKVVTGWSVYYNADFSDTMPECITKENGAIGVTESDCYLVPYSWEETQSNTILVYFYYSITDNQHFAFTDFTLEEVAHYSLSLIHI